MWSIKCISYWSLNFANTWTLYPNANESSSLILHCFVIIIITILQQPEGQVVKITKSDYSLWIYPFCWDISNLPLVYLSYFCWDTLSNPRVKYIHFCWDRKVILWAHGLFKFVDHLAPYGSTNFVSKPKNLLVFPCISSRFKGSLL